MDLLCIIKKGGTTIIYALILLRMLLLICSCYGCVRLVQTRMGIGIELSISVALCSIGGVLFTAGILNLLREAAFLIFFAGLVLCVLDLRKKPNVREILTSGTVFFLLLAVYFLFRLRGQLFNTYDNFSHWAIVARQILLDNRFPNFENANISFQSYPVGSACFLYYVLKIVGIAPEWLYMYAQIMLGAGCAISMFAFADRRSLFQNITVSVTVIFLLSSNISFSDLCVDTLLPLVGLSGMLLCISCRDRLFEVYPTVLPCLVYVVSVKNSGIFFAVVIILYCLVHLRRTCPRKLVLRTGAVLVAAPAVALLLWQKHVGMVFSAGMSTKHAMSVRHYVGMFAQKDSEVLSDITASFWRTVFSWSNQMLPVLAVLAFGWLVCRLTRRDKNEFPSAFLLIGGVYAFYQINLFFMYLFSMPNNEALELAGYSRYHQTIVIFCGGLLVCFLLDLLRKHTLAGSRFRHAMMALGCAAVLFLANLTVVPHLNRYRMPADSGADPIRLRLIAKLEEGRIPAGRSCLVLKDTSVSNGYIFYLMRYDQMTTDIGVYNEDELEKIGDRWRNYDYIFALDDTAAISAYMQKTFGVGAETVLQTSELPS